MVRLTDRPDMTLDVYRGRKTTTQQQQIKSFSTRCCCVHGRNALLKLSFTHHCCVHGHSALPHFSKLSSVFMLVRGTVKSLK